MPLIPRTKLEISTQLTLSTAHITEEDAARCDNDDTPHVLHGDEYSWRIFTDEELEKPGVAAMSPAFQEVMRLARFHGCRYLVLDQDGPVLSDLQKFDW